MGLQGPGFQRSAVPAVPVAPPHPSCLGYFGPCVPCQLSAGIADRELSDGK